MKANFVISNLRERTLVGCHEPDTTRVKTIKFVTISLAERGIIDIWRSLNPLEMNFTNYFAIHNVRSRIDIMNIGGKITGADVSHLNTL